MGTQLYILVDEDDQAFGPFDEAGVIGFGRAWLQEGWDDSAADDPSLGSMDFASWPDKEIWGELLEMDFGIHKLAASPNTRHAVILLMDFDVMAVVETDSEETASALAQAIETRGTGIRAEVMALEAEVAKAANVESIVNDLFTDPE